MNRLPLRFLLPFLCLGLLYGAPLPAADPTPAQRLLIVGDSTVCNNSPDSPRGGWGQYVQRQFKPTVQVINAAQDGSSSRTFLQQGRWAAMLAQKPAWVLIQFGHNDAIRPPDPRGTDAATEYTANLRHFVDTAREAGAVPILVTPMRHLDLKNGEPHDNLQPYAVAMMKVAEEKKAGLIDLFTSSTRLFKSVGEAGLAGFRSEPSERIHFNDQGAKAMAELVIRDLPKADPRLAEELRPKTPGKP